MRGHQSCEQHMERLTAELAEARAEVERLRGALETTQERAARALADPRAKRTDMLVQLNAINAVATQALSEDPST